MTFNVESSEVDVGRGTVKVRVLEASVTNQPREITCYAKIFPWAAEGFSAVLDCIGRFEWGDQVGDAYYIDPLDFSSIRQLPFRENSYQQIDFDTWQWVTDTAKVWETIRSRRASLLVRSDWTQLPDVPLATKEAWAVYRQALRDVTEQPDPFNIVWPVSPQ